MAPKSPHSSGGLPAAKAPPAQAVKRAKSKAKPKARKTQSAVRPQARAESNASTSGSRSSSSSSSRSSSSSSSSGASAAEPNSKKPKVAAESGPVESFVEQLDSLPVQGDSDIAMPDSDRQHDMPERTVDAAAEPTIADVGALAGDGSASRLPAGVSESSVKRHSSDAGLDKELAAAMGNIFYDDIEDDLAVIMDMKVP